MRTWEKSTFRRVAVSVADRYAVDATHELSVLGSVVSAVGGSASLVAVSGGSHLLGDTYRENLGSGYFHKLVEYPIFDLRLLRRCLQKVSSSIFGSFGSLLEDGIYCHASEGCRASRLDDVPVQSLPFHHHRRAVEAISYRGRQQHRGGVASHRGVPQRDWSQN